MLYRDVLRGEDTQIAVTVAIITRVKPDVLLLTDIDYDHDLLALNAYANLMGNAYPYRFAALPNTGQATGLDIDQNGRLGEARDAQGYGRFTGDGGMAILSRWPIDTAQVKDFSTLLWHDLPGAVLPPMDDTVQDVQRLSTTGHWIVPIIAPGGPLHLWAASATPPVFDGPEDRNGLRNRDELRLWEHAMAGHFGPQDPAFVIAGNTNLDPVDGDGYANAMAAFLTHPQIQDPLPASRGGVAAADANQRGNPAHDTADWADDVAGNLRVSYVLPSNTWAVTGAGVFWPAPDDPLAALLGNDGLAAGPHHLVWVDITR